MIEHKFWLAACWVVGRDHLGTIDASRHLVGKTKHASGGSGALRELAAHIYSGRGWYRKAASCDR